MRKSLLGLFVVSMLAMALVAGCGGSNEKKAAPAKAAGGQVAAPAAPVATATPVASAAPRMSGVIKGTDVNVREWAGTRSQVIGSVNTGDRVEVLGFLRTSGKYNWVKIRLANKSVGYVADNFVNIDGNIKLQWENLERSGSLWDRAQRAAFLANPAAGTAEPARFKDDAEIFYGHDYFTFSNGSKDRKYWYFVVFDKSSNAVAVHVSDYATGNVNSYHVFRGKPTTVSAGEYKNLLGDSFFR